MEKGGGGGWAEGAGVREIRNVSCAHKMMVQKKKKGNGGEQSSNGLSFQTPP